MQESVVVYAALAAVGLGLVLFFRKAKRRGSPNATTQDYPDIFAAVQRGDYARAALLANGHGRHEMAMEYFLRAQQPENAAMAAVRLNRVREAAEYYERAKNWERAAHFYEKAGIPAKAKEIRDAHLASKGPVAAPEDRKSRGFELERTYQLLAAKNDGSEITRGRIQAAARTAADALLGEGEIRRAADIFAEAGLDDEAIHLYANVLGQPALAAPVLARKGNHERAAELYELAGQNERAAAAWADIAKAAQKPEIFIDRIERLHRDAAIGLLEQLTSRKEVSSDSIELFYKLGSALARRGDSQRALSVYESIRSVRADFRDVAEQISKLEAGHSLKVAEPARSKTSAGEPPPLALTQGQLDYLAGQVVQVANAQLKKYEEVLSPVVVSSQVSGDATTEFGAVGLDRGAAKVRLLFDTAANAARVGPSVSVLHRYIGGRPCDLQNIEVYYRLGLAHLGAGDWQAALTAFNAVEEASPGYRDAWKRAEEIEGWRAILSAKATQFGVRDDGKSRYELRGELGRGGMAVVYRGFDTVLGRDVALKFLGESFGESQEMKELFQREARAVAALNHPNIVTVYDVGVLDKRAFICMEFVEGKTVEALASDSPGLTIVESLRIVQQALEALSYAHDRKIIHRDIKPANMMRSSAGLVKLMDFGLAKSIEKGTRQSVIAGTPQYMAPEQLRGQAVDHRADLFAVAVSIYELISGRLPFEGMDRHMPPPPLVEHIPALPESVNDIVMLGLEFDPERRPQTAAAMLGPISELVRSLANIGGAARPLKGAEGNVRPGAATLIVS